MSLQWRHNGRDSVSNHQPHDCLLNRLFRRRSKKTSKLRVTGLWAGNSPGTGEFPVQMASNAENVSIWWRHHVNVCFPWISGANVTVMPVNVCWAQDRTWKITSFVSVSITPRAPTATNVMTSTTTSLGNEQHSAKHRTVSVCIACLGICSICCGSLLMTWFNHNHTIGGWLPLF